LAKYGNRFSNLLGFSVQNFIQIRFDLTFSLHNVYGGYFFPDTV